MSATGRAPAAATAPPPTRTFVVVLAVAVVVIVGVGALIGVLNGHNHRPEGIAEHWLKAASDTGRKGLRHEATTRADKLGPLALAAPLLTNEPSKHEGYFTTLEVGKAARRGDEARVPFLAHPYAAHGSLPARDGTVLLARAGDTWRVAGLDRRRADERVPSEGGPPPSRAPAALWIGAIAFGFVLAGVAHVMVRVAEATARRAAAAASGPAGGVATG